MNRSKTKSMNMKNVLSGFFAAVLFSTITIASLRAQTNAPLENEMSNAVAATPGSQVATNNEDAPVRIDESGIHVGGPSPVDINIPNYHYQRHSLWNEVADNCVPLAGIFIGFAIPVTIIAICAYARHRRHQIANETLRAMIDKGLPITPELVDSLKSKRSEAEGEGTGNRSHKDLRNGLILTGIGIGIVVLCGKPGWIVLFLGVAFLLIGMLNLGKGNKNGDQPPKS
jgi:hypothetical protein